MEDPSHSRVKDGNKGETEQIPSESDALLEKLSAVIRKIERSNKCQPACSFELTKPNLKSQYERQAPVLRYLAAMIKGELKGAGRGFIVVAIALLKFHGEWRFIVAVNGHQSLNTEDKKKRLYRKIPTSIGGIPVDCLMDDARWRLPDEVAMQEITLDSQLTAIKGRRGIGKKATKSYVVDAEENEKLIYEHGEDEKVIYEHLVTVPKLTVETVWQWHSEQKLLRYVKVAYGTEVRQSIVALGISKEPCSYHVEGANHCEEYLERKYLRARSKNQENSVAAYWYGVKKGGSTLSPPCNYDYLRHFGIEITLEDSHTQRRATHTKTTPRAKGPGTNQHQASGSSDHDGQGRKRKHWQVDRKD